MHSRRANGAFDDWQLKSSTVGRGALAITKDTPHGLCGIVALQAFSPSLRRRYDAEFPAPSSRAAVGGIANGVQRHVRTSFVYPLDPRQRMATDR
jgi:hypothetical protein